MTVTEATLSAVLQDCFAKRSAPEALAWLTEKQTQIAADAPLRVFFTAFSTVPRHIEKAKLALKPEELKLFSSMHPTWVPQHWQLDQLGRALLLLSLPKGDIEQFSRSLDQLFSAADVEELVALYQALPLLPHPAQHRDRAAEGIRTNMTVVFNAIALRNPYPSEYLDEAAWNQMVLKALFVGSPLHLIQGLDRRANPALAEMLVSYAHERWAAGRSVVPALWRPVGQFATAAIAPDLEKVLADPDPMQQRAAALACAVSPAPQVRSLLDRRPDLQAAIASGKLTWNCLSDA